jgi:dihydrofolate reductase
LRKLILQMQTSVDGYVSAAREDLSWQVWDWGPDWTWDPALREYFNSVFDNVDTILLSRPMAEEGYLDHWRRTAEQHEGDPEYSFARRITDAEKLVATNKRVSSRWEKTTIAYGDLRDVVTRLKQTEGSDIISFGGTGFAESLIAYGLPPLVQENPFSAAHKAMASGSLISHPKRTPAALLSTAMHRRSESFHFSCLDPLQRVAVSSRGTRRHGIVVEKCRARIEELPRYRPGLRSRVTPRT